MLNNYGNVKKFKVNYLNVNHNYLIIFHFNKDEFKLKYLKLMKIISKLLTSGELITFTRMKFKTFKKIIHLKTNQDIGDRGSGVFLYNKQINKVFQKKVSHDVIPIIDWIKSQIKHNLVNELSTLNSKYYFNDTENSLLLFFTHHSQ